MSMISKEFVITLAKYNIWQNQAVYGAADNLNDADRKRNLGVFFQSIHQTLSHLFWGDSTWLCRFTQQPYNNIGIESSVHLFDNWEKLKEARYLLDQEIMDWANHLKEDWLSEVVFYHNSKNLPRRKKADMLVTHFFNHQTHHRGQVHAMLTHYQIPTQDTDLILLPVV